MAGLDTGAGTPLGDMFQDSVTKSLSALCLDASLSDVKFVFPEEPGKVGIPAHRLILAMRSAVFRTMFYGSLPEKGPEVKIVDIASDIFSSVLRYVYSDEVSIDDETVIPLLHASQKYELLTLLHECENYLEGALNVKNVCTILNHAALFGMEDLIKDALSFLEINAAEVFKEESFTFLTQGNFAMVLKSERIGTAEINIFNAAIRWADEQCTKAEKAVNGENRRQALGNMLYQIRFNLLSLEDFSNVVVPTEVLTDDILLKFYKLFTQKNFDPDAIAHFIKTPRLEYPPLEVNLQALTQIPTCTFVQSGGVKLGLMGERGVQSLETVSVYTTQPMKIRQLDFVPTPMGTPDHPKIGHNPQGEFRIEQALVYIDDVSGDIVKPIYKGKIPLGLKTSLKFDFILQIGDWTKLAIGVSKMCSVCGIMVAPDYNKIPEQYTRNRHGNSIKSPNTKSVAAFGGSFQIATSGQNIIKSIRFEKEYPMNLCISQSQ
ncbi:BTB/POZ domain-containing protein 6-like [Ylistrum balloti]|uniref:BTB/POZ domain-containing protein 6-like n=1 Tax=Ylistrum balloti TaxID=509963 RepID=UPI002905AC76|nr:BTB/POZ domain-containing protein 6-like [Ylistrum balloti]